KPWSKACRSRIPISRWRFPPA
ncbi:hypothetical protein MyNCGM70_60160, partial [Achromobacter xylosoxidans]